VSHGNAAVKWLTEKARMVVELS